MSQLPPRELPFSMARPHHILVEVPWTEARRLRRQLQADGIPATAVYNPREHVAGLEVPDSVDLKRIQLLLSERPNRLSRA